MGATLFVIWFVPAIVSMLLWLAVLMSEVAIYRDYRTSEYAQNVRRIARKFWWPLVWPAVLAWAFYWFVVDFMEAFRKSA